MLSLSTSQLSTGRSNQCVHHKFVTGSVRNCAPTVQALLSPLIELRETRGSWTTMVLYLEVGIIESCCTRCPTWPCLGLEKLASQLR